MPILDDEVTTMRMFLLILCLMLALSGALAAEHQAYLGIFAQTSVNKMVGMPDMTEMMKQLPPGMPLPPGMMMGMPKRDLSVRLWSPGLAPKEAFAWLAVPAGLKLGARLDLELYRPKAESGTVGKGAVDPAKVPDFTIKRYWGSSPTVKPGQPEVIRFTDLTPEQKVAAREEASTQQDSYFYKPDWTTGYWPTKKQPGAIAGDAVLHGKFSLTTNYTGTVALDVPDTVKFLNPIETSSPKLDKPIDFSKPMVFRWKPIPGVLGFHAYIIGMKGKNLLITWSSAEVRTDYGINFDFMQMADVIDNVKKTVFMAPECTEVIVPAGIFTDCDFVHMVMVGYGTGAALGEGQPLPRCQTKTTLTLMLGGKEMEKQMGGFGDFDMGGEDDGE